MKLISCVAVLLLLTACGTMNMTEALPNIGANKQEIENFMSGSKTSCTPLGKQYSLLSQDKLSTMGLDQKVALLGNDVFEQQSLQTIFDLKSLDKNSKDLPKILGDDKVIKQVLEAANSGALSAQQSVANLAGLRVDFTPFDAAPSPQAITENDLKAFAENVRLVVLSSDFVQDESNNVPGFKSAFVAYFKTYYAGKYVDRFGTKLPKPSISRTIGNTEIAGTIQVLLELTLDYKFKTPVWKDSDTQTYFPGDIKEDSKPTAVVEKLAPVLTLLKETDSKSCGITPLKIEAIEYLSGLGADRGTALAGLVGGSFGGMELGFGVLGKVSIGDNQTLQVIAKTLLSKTFERAAEEASYRALYWIGYNPKTELIELLQKYLEYKNKPSS